MKLELPNSTEIRWDSEEGLSRVYRADVEMTENEAMGNERVSIDESNEMVTATINVESRSSTKSTCLCCQCMGKLHRRTSSKQQRPFTQDQMARLRILIRTEVGLYHVLVPILVNSETKINLKFFSEYPCSVYSKTSILLPLPSRRKTNWR